ncbi:MAG: hypothetical protein AAGG38_00425 [Planctomycetota bacterium]
MNRKTIGLIVVVLLLGAGYWKLYQARQLPPLEVVALHLPGQPLQFAFNGDTVVREVKVLRPAPEPQEGAVFLAAEDQTLWHMIPREPPEGEALPELTPTNLVRYGRRVRGLRPAPDTPRRGLPLQPDVAYRFIATTDDGVIELDFVYDPPN